MESLTRQTRWIASAYNVIGLYSVPLLTIVTVISMCNVFLAGYFSQYPFIGSTWAFIFSATIDVNIVRLFLESYSEQVKGNIRTSRIAFTVALGLAIVTGAALLVEGLQQSIGIEWNSGTVKGFIGILIAARVVLVVVLMAREGVKLGASLIVPEPTERASVPPDDTLISMLDKMSQLQAQKEQAVNDALFTLQTTVERLTKQQFHVEPESELERIPEEAAGPHLELVRSHEKTDVGSTVQRFIERELERGHTPTLTEIMNATGCSKGSASRYRSSALNSQLA